jgi:uncharacterized protein YbbK (DUF523 family)
MLLCYTPIIPQIEVEFNTQFCIKTGQDVTKQFVCGAQRMLAFCQEIGIETAILAATGPSCGSRETYDGTHSGTIRPGKGVTAELLEQNGVRVYNQVNYRGNI